MGRYTFQHFRDQWIGQVIRNPTLEPMDKLCGIVLAVEYTCEKTGSTCPPIAMIASRVSISQKNVEQAIERLLAEDFLYADGSTDMNRVNRYLLTSE